MQIWIPIEPRRIEQRGVIVPCVQKHGRASFPLGARRDSRSAGSIKFQQSPPASWGKKAVRFNTVDSGQSECLPPPKTYSLPEINVLLDSPSGSIYSQIPPPKPTLKRKKFKVLLKFGHVNFFTLFGHHILM